MQGVDLQGRLNQVMNDAGRKIPQAHLDRVCKLHQGKTCCRYIGLGPQGFVCVKRSQMKEVLDNLVSEQKMVAQGDNCEGLGNTDLVEHKSPETT